MNDLKEEKGTREELRRSQAAPRRSGGGLKDRKSTRLNSSHSV